MPITEHSVLSSDCNQRYCPPSLHLAEIGPSILCITVVFFRNRFSLAFKKERYSMVI